MITRGGGSIEDLWEFNEEIVARAIAASTLPIVSAVGHEIDFTIADFVADLRAPTPSAAAELIVPDAAELERRVSELANCLQRFLGNFIERERARLRAVSERTLGRELLTRLKEASQRIDWRRDLLLRHAHKTVAEARAHLGQLGVELRRHDPAGEIAQRRNRLDELARRLPNNAKALNEQKRKQFERAQKILSVLGPQATLGRGYSITMDERGKIIRSTTAVRPKMKIRTRLRDGEFSSEVL